MQAADSLGPLVDEVVFLGGASLGLWLSDPGAAEPRVTVDVDVVVVVAGYGGYQALGDRLRERGFVEDSASGVICRWRHRSGTILDVMPTDDSVLGFSNRWYSEAFDTAVLIDLPDGRAIRAAAPAYLVATKIEAFASVC
jgi:predicted nucleotidyltransferase